MKYFHDPSLRTKLVINSLVITLIPLTIIGYVSNLYMRQEMIASINQSLDGAAHETVANLDGFIQGNLDVVRTEAQLPDLGEFLGLSSEGRTAGSVSTNPEARIATILLAFSRRDQLFITSYALLDINGINVIDTDLSNIGVDQSRQDYFREPVATGLPYASSVDFSETANLSSIYFSAPIRNRQGKIVGVLRMGYNASILQQIISNMSGLTGKDSYVVLLDENHLRLADGSMPDLNFKTIVPLDRNRVVELQAVGRLPQWSTDQLATDLPVFEQDLANATTEKFFSAQLHETGTGLDMVAVESMKTEPWLIAFAQSQSVLLTPIDRQARILLLVTLIATVLVTLTAIGGSRMVINPILKLTAQLKETLGGLSKSTVELRQANEQLQAEMVERQRGEDALRKAEMRYRSLVEHNPAITYIISNETPYNTVYISPQVENFLGFTPEEWLADPDIWSRQIYPADRERVLAEHKARCEDNRPFINEYRIFTHDSKLIWLHDETYPFQEPGLTPIIQGIEYDITDRKEAEEKIQRQVERLTALSEIDNVINSSSGLTNSLGAVLDHVTKQLGVDATVVYLFNSTTNTLSYTAGKGFRTKSFEWGKTLSLGDDFAGRSIMERRTIHIPNLRDQNGNSHFQKGVMEEGFISSYNVPLITKGQIKGVLAIYQRSPLEPDEEWLDFLQILAGQAAIAIDNATMFDGLQHSNIELSLAYEETIEGWSHALDLRDKETEGHTQRVTELTMTMAGLFGFKDEQLMGIRRGSLLHDIGKMGVPDGILLKPGPLTDEEWILMKKHPTIAFEMLAPIHYLRSAMDIPYCHHEKWDGSGYPRGLKGDQIPLVARIFAIVDVWDALTSDRPYRKAWSIEQAVEYLISESGRHFDPAVLKICLDADLFDYKSAI